MATNTWSLLPPEIALQIGYHNVDDAQTLRAMRLVSQEMCRASTEPLFSVLGFYKEEDLVQFSQLLHDTPVLAAAANTVKMSISLTGPSHPMLPCLRNVEEVQWSQNGPWDSEIARTYMVQIFPRATRLALRDIIFEHPSAFTLLLAVCNPLQAIDIQRCMTASWEPRGQAMSDPDGAVLDFSELRELTLVANSGSIKLPATSNGKPNLPTRLRTLKLLSDRDFINVHIDESRDPCSLLHAILFMRSSASSLTQVTINPHSRERHATGFNFAAARNPSLTALTELALHLGDVGGDTYVAEFFFASVTTSPMPQLTTLRFVCHVRGRDDEPEWLHGLFGFGANARPLHADSLRVKFPSLQKVVWAFRAANHRTDYKTVGTVPELARTEWYREAMERELFRRLEEVEMGDAERLRSLVSIEWLDPMYRPLY
ncbi:hypothetical protein HMN09_00344000 [Mycena chlorophos]|uniref:Uncharacterized protein n=1 Tax=Mycena chlorophos TaxID=658473 RepID=A0A8H6TKG3_MYCCL|nr:hypothetical protein HMN09_00344000 [Mycena chlorophos]